MSVGTWYQKIHDHPAGRVLLHVFLWIFFYGLQFYIVEISLGSNDEATAYLVPLKNTITTIIAFYLLIYFVWWRWWKSKRYVVAAAGTIAVILIYALVDYAAEQFILSYCQSCVETLKRNQPAYYEFLQNDSASILFARIISLGIVYQLILSLAIPAGIKFMLIYFRQRVQTLQLRNENMMLELNLLKAQINPHFLFNTLNNIYALILNDRKNESAETVARLSAFLRYSLYETNEAENVVLKEVDVLKDYINLEKIRLNQTEVTFRYETDKPSYTLPPLLFIPAVENAFKYCVEEKGKRSEIAFLFQIVNGLLTFRASNTYDHERIDEKPGGIGLENLKKRLARYYPENHKLEVNKSESHFTLFVEINLFSDD